MRSFQNFALACDHTRGHIFASDDNAHSENQLNIVELIITQMVKEGNTANATNSQKFFQRGFSESPPFARPSPNEESEHPKFRKVQPEVLFV